jgi:predicted XRE-type DNA-binding protein
MLDTVNSVQVAPATPPVKSRGRGGRDLIVLRAATGLRSKASRRAIAAEALSRFTGLSQADAASLLDVSTPYVSVVAISDAHELMLIASGRLSISQILEGQRIARHYDPVMPGTEHDAELDRIGVERVRDWANRKAAALATPVMLEAAE